jgi:hypothetical protein
MEGRAPMARIDVVEGEEVDELAMVTVARLTLVVGAVSVVVAFAFLER